MATTAPTRHLHASDDPELVRTPAVHYVAVPGSGAPGTDDFYRKKLFVGELARTLGDGDARPVIEIQYWYPEHLLPVEIADFYSVNPVDALQYRVMAAVPEGTTVQELADARARAGTPDSAADVVELLTVPEQDVVQVLHHGPFAEELATLGRLGRFAASLGLRRSGPHHELHLDAFSRTTPQATLRTILRDPVA
ncbi:GyrI-like domain-containing protein [Nocardioides sp. CPCC 205120]|uniref:GyrI-like domain-containing protein n=1 Tax=Nocardioides sp. CPCC 205120 TaxID=3406462 RepID=UPI003B51541E